MRTWILFLFCLVVVVAFAQAEREPNRAYRKNDRKSPKEDGNADDGSNDKPGKKKALRKKGENDRNGDNRHSKNHLKKPGKKTLKEQQEKKKPLMANNAQEEHYTNKKNEGKMKLSKRPENVKNAQKVKQSAKGCDGNCVETAKECEGKVMKRQQCPDGKICCSQGKRDRKKEKQGSGVKRFCKPLDACTKLTGECNKKKSGCKAGEKLFKSTKKIQYCDKKTCVCCAKPCKQKKTCSKDGGTCQFSKGACDGVLSTKNSKGKKYCNGKTCACCIPTPSTAVPSTVTSSCSVTRPYCPNCGVANINVADIRIVNGSEASVDEYPYQVFVAATILEGGNNCGGSIIKKKWILTAAHCFFDENGNQAAQNAIEVRYGNINWLSATSVMASRYILHENYDATIFANDIALVELPAELNFENNPSIQPICLAEDSDIPYGGKSVASGWGAIAFEGQTSYVLREVALDVINITTCETMYYTLPPDLTKVVCALTPYKDTCQGDSGGPLVARVCPNRWVQIGIVSNGFECARPDAPGIYMKVSAYRTWIDSNTGSSSAC